MTRVLGQAPQPFSTIKNAIDAARRKRRYSTEEMLASLQRLLKKYGTLNKTMIDNAHGISSANAIACRFGSLKAAYAQIGFQSVSNNKYTKINTHVSALAGRAGKVFAKQLGETRLQHMGSVCRLDRDGASIIVLIARYIDGMDGSARWYVQWDKLDLATIAVIGLMDFRHSKVSSYHIVTGPDIAELQKRKSRDDGRCLHAFVQPDLDACVTRIARHMNLLS